MKNLLLVFITFIFFHTSLNAQNGLLSGPWAGHVELRSAVIWMEVHPTVKSIEVRYAKSSSPQLTQSVKFLGELKSPVKIDLVALDFNTTYLYDVLIDDKKVAEKLSFTTKDLWNHRKPAPDFSFLTGSCAYFNEPVFDRPGRIYGGDSTIFSVMAKTPAAFNLWLGDSWYTREVDYSTVWGMQYRVALDRRRPILQPLLQAMPQYFIWDDHDFGPNDSGKEFIYKKESREIFKSYTLNPSYGEKEEGIYTRFGYADVDIFMTDNRYFRSMQRYPDTINSIATEKTYFGKMQMEWLKNALLQSRATFKIIASGSQVLNFATTYDCMCGYKSEFNELMDFIREAKVEGVIFLTGDRHHSEVIRYDQQGVYTLFDITVSPFTAGVGRVRGSELENPARISGTLIEEQNFGKISVSGPKNERKLTVEYFGLKGNKLATWSISESALKFK